MDLKYKNCSLMCVNIYSEVINIHSGSIFMESLTHKFTSSMNYEFIHYSEE